MENTDPEYERKVQRQLAILDVARRSNGAESGPEITAELLAAFDARGVPHPPEGWTNAVATDISDGSTYVIDSEILAEAMRRVEHSRAGTGRADASGALTIREIRVPVGPGASIRAFLAAPAGTGPWPAVVLLPDVFGADADMLLQLRALAAAGYLALLPDRYDGVGRLGRALSVLRWRPGARAEAPPASVGAARTFLLARSDCTGKMAILGFGSGAAPALAAAAEFDAVVVFNAGVPDPDPRPGGAPVLGITPYPKAGRDLQNSVRRGPRWLHPATRRAVASDPAGAADSRARTEAFLREQLAGGD